MFGVDGWRAMPLHSDLAAGQMRTGDRYKTMKML